MWFYRTHSRGVHHLFCPGGNILQRKHMLGAAVLEEAEGHSEGRGDFGPLAVPFCCALGGVLPACSSTPRSGRLTNTLAVLLHCRGWFCKCSHLLKKKRLSGCIFCFLIPCGLRGCRWPCEEVKLSSRGECLWWWQTVLAMLHCLFEDLGYS